MEIYKQIKTGEIAGSATAAQLPDIPCQMVMFKAVASNTGDVYIGVAGVTVADGTADATSGLELSPGQFSPWIPIDNLKRLYLICDNATDDLTYMAMQG